MRTHLQHKRTHNSLLWGCSNVSVNPALTCRVHAHTPIGGPGVHPRDVPTLDLLWQIGERVGNTVTAITALNGVATLKDCEREVVAALHDACIVPLHSNPGHLVRDGVHAGGYQGHAGGGQPDGDRTGGQQWHDHHSGHGKPGPAVRMQSRPQMTSQQHHQVSAASQVQGEETRVWCILAQNETTWVIPRCFAQATQCRHGCGRCRGRVTCTLLQVDDYDFNFLTLTLTFWTSAFDLLQDTQQTRPTNPDEIPLSSSDDDDDDDSANANTAINAKGAGTAAATKTGGADPVHVQTPAPARCQRFAGFGVGPLTGHPRVMRWWRCGPRVDPGQGLDAMQVSRMLVDYMQQQRGTGGQRRTVNHTW